MAQTFERGDIVVYEASLDAVNQTPGYNGSIGIVGRVTDSIAGVPVHWVGRKQGRLLSFCKENLRKIGHVDVEI
jgi:hypothetical protein